MRNIFLKLILIVSLLYIQPVSSQFLTEAEIKSGMTLEEKKAGWTVNDNGEKVKPKRTNQYGQAPQKTRQNIYGGAPQQINSNAQTTTSNNNPKSLYGVAPSSVNNAPQVPDKNQRGWVRATDGNVLPPPPATNIAKEQNRNISKPTRPVPQPNRQLPSRPMNYGQLPPEGVSNNGQQPNQRQLHQQRQIQTIRSRPLNYGQLPPEGVSNNGQQPNQRQLHQQRQIQAIPSRPTVNYGGLPADRVQSEGVNYSKLPNSNLNGVAPINQTQAQVNNEARLRQLANTSGSQSGNNNTSVNNSQLSRANNISQLELKKLESQFPKVPTDSRNMGSKPSAISGTDNAAPRYKPISAPPQKINLPPVVNEQVKTTSKSSPPPKPPRNKKMAVNPHKVSNSGASSNPRKKPDQTKTAQAKKGMIIKKGKGS